MTLPVYRSLCAQFLRETEAAASHNLIDKTKANFIKAAINLALEAERAPDSRGAVPPAAPSLGRDRRSLSDTRLLP